MEPATILAKAEGYNVAEIYKQVVGYMKALLGFINGKENKSSSDQTFLSASYPANPNFA